MSIKNIIDGSYDVNVPIDIEKLSTTLTSQFTANLTFNKIGNMCTVNINSPTFSTASNTLSLFLTTPIIENFKPKENIRRDVQIIVNGNPTWCTFASNLNLFSFYIPLSISVSSVSINSLEPIIYNTD